MVNGNRFTIYNSLRIHPRNHLTFPKLMLNHVAIVVMWCNQLQQAIIQNGQQPVAICRPVKHKIDIVVGSIKQGVYGGILVNIVNGDEVADEIEIVVFTNGAGGNKETAVW